MLHLISIDSIDALTGRCRSQVIESAPTEKNLVPSEVMQLPLQDRGKDSGDFRQYLRLCVYCSKLDSGENPLLATPAKLRIDDGVLTEFFNFEAEERKLHEDKETLEKELKHGPTYAKLGLRMTNLFEEHPLVRAMHTLHDS